MMARVLVVISFVGYFLYLFNMMFNEYYFMRNYKSILLELIDLTNIKKDLEKSKLTIVVVNQSSQMIILDKSFLNDNEIEKEKGLILSKKYEISDEQLKSELEKLFTFRNYFIEKFIWFIHSDEIKTFRILKQQMIKILSFERIISVMNDAPVKPEYIETNQIKNFFIFLDILPNNTLYYIGSQKYFKSINGGFLWLIYLGLFIPGVYYFGYDFWFRVNPSIEEFNA